MPTTPANADVARATAGDLALMHFREALGLAAQIDDVVGQGNAHYCIAGVLSWQAENDGARAQGATDHFRQALALHCQSLVSLANPADRLASLQTLGTIVGDLQLHLARLGQHVDALLEGDAWRGLLMGDNNTEVDSRRLPNQAPQSLHTGWV
eukprot:m.1152 g.1152  ORF g.1152 m.1152 type:complete len:153 (-) comp440_c1_seq1:321-779(-)